MGIGMVGIEADRLFQAGPGLPKFSLGPQDGTEVAVSIRQVRAELEGAIHICDGFIEPAEVP